MVSNPPATTVNAAQLISPPDQLKTPFEETVEGPEIRPEKLNTAPGATLPLKLPERVAFPVTTPEPIQLARLNEPGEESIAPPSLLKSQSISAVPLPPMVCRVP